MTLPPPPPAEEAADDEEAEEAAVGVTRKGEEAGPLLSLARLLPPGERCRRS